MNSQKIQRYTSHVETNLIQKLNSFMHGSVFDQEKDIVYLMVLLRKLLEITNTANKYPFIKFYADWTVHISKDRISPTIQQFLKRIDHKITKTDFLSMTSTASAVMTDFIYMRQLQSEIQELCKKFRIKDTLTLTEGRWETFVINFIELLADQPIRNHNQNDHIQYFAYESINRTSVIWQVKYNDEDKIYRYVNVW